MPGTHNSSQRSNMRHIERELGSMTARLDDLDRRITHIERDVKEIRSFILSAKGSWKALIVVAAISSTLTAFALKLSHFFK